MDWTETFCAIDDFCQVFEPEWRQRQLESGERRRKRKQQLTLSEMMAIVVMFQSSNYRTFKYFYLMVRSKHRAEFPNLVSYSRFVQLMPSMLGPMCAYLKWCFGTCTGIAFVDSTALAVCKNKRIERNRVFAEMARLGKTTMGWFFGFKLHLIINDRGELLAVRLTPGNVDDRVPVPEMVGRITGKLFGDKGYISARLFIELWQHGLQLVTQIRRNMKNRLIPLIDKILLRKRSLIETVNDQLKNIAQIEHSRHRSVANFMVNLLAGLISYCHQPKKPSLRFNATETRLLGLHAADASQLLLEAN
jgi:hypothetical protein